MPCSLSSFILPKPWPPCFPCAPALQARNHPRKGCFIKDMYGSPQPLTLALLFSFSHTNLFQHPERSTHLIDTMALPLTGLNLLPSFYHPPESSQPSQPCTDFNDQIASSCDAGATDAAPVSGCAMGSPESGSSKNFRSTRRQLRGSS